MPNDGEVKILGVRVRVVAVDMGPDDFHGGRKRVWGVEIGGVAYTAVQAFALAAAVEAAAREAERREGK